MLLVAVWWSALAALLTAGADTWWSVGLVAVLGMSVVAVLACSVVSNLRTIIAARRPDRPIRFAVAGGVFAVPVRRVPSLAAVADLVLSIGLLGVVLLLRQSGADRSVPTALVAGGVTFIGSLAMAAACMALLSWPGLAPELTPQGVRHRAGRLLREVPWSALAPSGPRRPGPGDDWLVLLVARPELVVTQGWLPSLDSASRVYLPLGLDIHPWLLADAINWYAEHPEHRPAIGTQAEHDRLLTVLAAPST